MIISFALEIECEIPNEIKLKSFRCFSFQQHQIHGIPIEKVIKEKSNQVFNYKELKSLLFEIYCRLRTEDKTLFAVKNHQLAALLLEYDIPFLDLEKIKVGNEVCPPLHRFESLNFQTNTFCLLHFLLYSSCRQKKIRCSLKKSANIWYWLKTKINTEFILNDICEAIRECA